MANTTNSTWTTRTTDHIAAETTTRNGSTNHVPVVGSDPNDGGGSHKPVPKSQLPTAAVLGGIVFLIIICIVVVLVYRKKSQRKYKQRKKKTEEEVGFMDADVENRRSDIAMQLLQVNDPSFFEIEEATQNAKLQELQGQNDLNLMEIINGSGVTENKVEGKKQDKVPNSQSEGQNNAISGCTVNDNNEAKSSKSIIPGSSTDIKKTATSSNISATDSPAKQRKDDQQSNLSGTITNSGNDIKTESSSHKSVTTGQSDSHSKEKRATSLQMPNVRVSHAEKSKQRKSEIVGNPSRKSETKKDTQEQNSSMESRVEQRLKQRQSARSSGGTPTGQRTSEKLNNGKPSHPPIGGGVAPEIAQTASARDSKHSSGGYDEALKQLKHVDSDPNLTESHSTK